MMMKQDSMSTLLQAQRTMMMTHQVGGDAEAHWDGDELAPAGLHAVHPDDVDEYSCCKCSGGCRGT